MSDYILLVTSVLAGGLTAFFIGKKQAWLSLLVTFSGAYLFAVIVFHLLPEIYGTHEHGISVKTTGAFLLAGLVFQLLLEHISHGVEHAHEQSVQKGLTVGILLGLFIHAFSEGLPVHQLHSHAYLSGILIHKFPIALILTSFLLGSGVKKRKTLAILILFSLMTPLGTRLGEKWDFLIENHVYVSAFVAGILTHISTVIIFESDTQHNIPVKKWIVILLAFILAYLN
jgi:zinc transporter ZupT